MVPLTSGPPHYRANSTSARSPGRAAVTRRPSITPASFVYCLLVLRSVHGDPAPFVPGIALTGAILLALASLGGLVWFIHHIVTSIQANHLVDRIADETDEVKAACLAAIDLGAVRTMQLDVEFGVRQLVDIALKAVSPAVNDPSTAATCIDHLGRLLVRLAGRKPLPVEQGGVVFPRPTHGELLDLACDQLRQYGRTDMAVVLRLMRVLGQVAAVTRQRSSLRRIEAQARLLDAAAAAAFAAEDCEEPARRRAVVTRYTG